MDRQQTYRADEDPALAHLFPRRPQPATAPSFEFGSPDSDSAAEPAPAASSVGIRLGGLTDRDRAELEIEFTPGSPLADPRESAHPRQSTPMPTSESAAITLGISPEDTPQHAPYRADQDPALADMFGGAEDEPRYVSCWALLDWRDELVEEMRNRSYGRPAAESTPTSEHAPYRADQDPALAGMFPGGGNVGRFEGDDAERLEAQLQSMEDLADRVADLLPLARNTGNASLISAWERFLEKISEEIAVTENELELLEDEGDLG